MDCALTRAPANATISNIKNQRKKDAGIPERADDLLLPVVALFCQFVAEVLVEMFMVFDLLVIVLCVIFKIIKCRN